MPSSTPLWKQLFDAVDERLSPTINDLARSEDAATLAALGRRGRSELDRRMEQASRRTLHLLNLPAGSDVNRLLEHIARLEREVRDLRNLLTDRENAEYLASLAARHQAREPAQKSARKPATTPTNKAAAKRRVSGGAPTRARAKGGAGGNDSGADRSARSNSA
jgi:hypothetical protein